MPTRRPQKRDSAENHPRTAEKSDDGAQGGSIAVAIDRVSTSALAQVLGVDVRSIANFVDDGMPKDARGEYPLARCVQWYVDRERSAARASKGLNDLDKARLRKTDAEAKKAELEAKQLEGELIPKTDVEDIVGSLCDRLRPIVMNIPTTYGMRLEEAGVSATESEKTLEAVAEELMVALRGVANDLDEIAEHDGDDEGIAHAV